MRINLMCICCRVTSMKGGAYIAEGSYGCVFDGHLKCLGEDKGVAPSPAPQETEKDILKIFDDDGHLQKEWVFAKSLASIDPDQRYFYYSTSRCVTDIGNIQKMDGIGQCKLLSSMVKTLPKAHRIGFLKMPNGGMPMHTAIMHHKLGVGDVLRALLPVLEGIKRLNKAGFLHHDLKYDNILYRHPTKECRIIDFSLVIEKKDAYDRTKNTMMKQAYWVHPPEYGVIYSNKRDHKTFLTFLKSCYWQLTTDKSFLHLFVDYVWPLPELEEAYLQDVKIRKTYVDRIDVYSFGLTVFVYMIHLQLPPSAWPKGLRECIRGMTHPNPSKRWTLKKVETCFTKMLRDLA